MAANPFGTTIPRGATSFYDFSQNDDGQQPVATTQDDGGNGTPAPPSLATPTLVGNGGSSSSTTTTTTTATSPYAQSRVTTTKNWSSFFVVRWRVSSLRQGGTRETRKA